MSLPAPPSITLTALRRGDRVVARAGDDVLDAPQHVGPALARGGAAASLEAGAEIDGDVGGDRRHVERVVAGDAGRQLVTIVGVVAVALCRHDEVVAGPALHRCRRRRRRRSGRRLHRRRCDPCRRRRRACRRPSPPSMSSSPSPPNTMSRPPWPDRKFAVAVAAQHVGTVAADAIALRRRGSLGFLIVVRRRHRRRHRLRHRRLRRCRRPAAARVSSSSSSSRHRPAVPRRPPCR